MNIYNIAPGISRAFSASFDQNNATVSNLREKSDLKYVDQAIEHTSDNATIIGISAITIFGATLAVATVVNFAAAIWFGMPLATLWFVGVGLDNRIDELENNLYRSKNVTAMNGPQTPEPAKPTTPPTANNFPPATGATKV